MVESLLMVTAAVGGQFAGAEAGMALKKLIGPQPLLPDTSVPGVKQATVQKPGKDNDILAVAQLDPTEGLNYFKLAAQAYTVDSIKGMGMYSEAALSAISALTAGASDANHRYDSVVSAGDQATNRYLNMVGLDGFDGSKAYHGTDAVKALENTPGYQFAVQQGNQAAARNALMTGGASGNTLAAAQTYAQGLAQQNYQGYLTNLQPLITAGNAAKGSQAANDMQEGTNLAHMFENIGNTSLKIWQDIGAANSNMYTNQGHTWLAAAQSNVETQNTSMEAERQRQAGKESRDSQSATALAQQQIASAPAMMNAQTNREQFQYSVFQGQQAGQTAQQTANMNAPAW